MDSNVKKAFPHSFYTIKYKLSDSETQVANKIIAIVRGKSSSIDSELAHSISDIIETQEILNVFPDKVKFEKLNTNIIDFIRKMGASNPEQIAGYVADKTYGFGKMGPLVRDDELEEIMINGAGKNVFVWHKKHGMCKTDIIYDRNELEQLISKIAKTVGKGFSEKEPLLDARLADGSRANATYDSVTPFGMTLTIRKFSSSPISITSLIKNNTISPELAAFFWLCTEGFGINPLNMLVIGGTGTGKTTLLVALTSFIRYSDRIITIEDTPEINLGDRDNLISMESRPKIEDSKEITMNDLLKNALRMRPDRIIVGEVRSEEAQTLFTAMDTGHRGILGTLHANNPKESIIRLKSYPMNVPETNIPLLDLVVCIRKQYVEGEGLSRKIYEVAELDRMEGSALISNIYERRTHNEEIKRTDVPMRTIEKLSSVLGATKQEISDELKIRTKILETLVENEIYDYVQITKFVQKYYEDPESIVSEVFK